MNPNDVAEQLNSFLDDAREEMKRIDLTKPDAHNRSRLVSFTSTMLSILDYSFNHYPRCRNNDYFPRPRLNEPRNDYVLRVNNLKKKSKKIQITKPLRQFLISVYDINTKHRHALSLLPSGLKHGADGTVHAIKEPTYEYSLTTTGNENPVRRNADGSLDIGSFIHAEPGSRVTIKDSRLVSPTQDIHIEHLQYMSVNSGIVDFDGERRGIKEWMSNCISICQELIALYNRGYA